MQTLKINLAELAPNTGQIPGLPSNPRQWTKSDVDKIAASLKETPELFEARPIIAVPYEGKYVILGGNLRFEGAKKNKDKTAPVCVIPEDTPIEKMKEIVIKDNGTFGAWDIDSLANEWDALPLQEWGVPAWSMPDDLPDLSSTWGDGDRPNTGVLGSLAGRFVVPPFSILDSRQGYWMERKKMWRELIGDNGESRENTLAGGAIPN